MDWAGTLRNELQKRALAWAASQAVPYYTSLGQSPTVLFEQTIDYGGHGNFHPDSWIAIANNASWKTRLEKPHPKRQALPIEKASARELDSSNSSDASLMNCFCFPSTSSRIIKGLGLSAGSEFPEFGVKANGTELRFYAWP
jgi:hypothetical protein